MESVVEWYSAGKGHLEDCRVAKLYLGDFIDTARSQFQTERFEISVRP